MIHSEYSFIDALAGGVLIGLGSLLAFLASGVIPGISGLFSRILRFPSAESVWRLVFFAGLLAGAGLLFTSVDSASAYRPGSSLVGVAAAGLLVGFGTRLGGGCTSGHGVCGIGLGSRTSLVATVLFMASGIATVWLFRHLNIPLLK
jgi:uncharacterized membrane protein YedE/YeeE